MARLGTGFGLNRPTIRRVTAQSLALSALLLLGACGGGGDGKTSGDTGNALTTAPTTETTGISEDQAKQLTSSMLLRLSDFPTGWRAEPHEEVEGCVGIDKLSDRYDMLARGDSKDFAKGDTTEASSSAGLFNDETTARDALNYVEAAIQGEEFRNCVTDVLHEQSNEDVTFGEIHVGQVSFPTLGDRSSAWEVVVPAETQGLSVEVYFDAVYIVRSSAFGVVLFSDVLTPFDEQERERLARLVSERMDEAVAKLP